MGTAARRRFTHGLESTYAVTALEEAADFVAYRHAMLEALQPDGVVEEDLTEMMVMCQWKLRRLWRLEGAQYFLWKGRGEREGASGWSATIASFLADCREGQIMERITHREAHLMRNYQRAESRLRQRQDERRGRLGEQTRAAQGEAPARASAVGLPEAPATPCSAPLSRPEPEAGLHRTEQGTGASAVDLPEAPASPRHAPHSEPPQPPPQPSAVAPPADAAVIPFPRLRLGSGAGPGMRPAGLSAMEPTHCPDTGTGEIWNRPEPPDWPRAVPPLGSAGDAPGCIPGAAD